MNEFVIVDSEGRTHWIMTCLSCKALVETDNMESHIRFCASKVVNR